MQIDSGKIGNLSVKSTHRLSSLTYYNRSIERKRGMNRKRNGRKMSENWQRYYCSEHVHVDHTDIQYWTVSKGMCICVHLSSAYNLMWFAKWVLIFYSHSVSFVCELIPDSYKWSIYGILLSFCLYLAFLVQWM